MIIIKKRLLCLLLLCSHLCMFGQATGDIVIIGFNADGDDDLAFVTFSDISPNTNIYFTDREADGSGGFTTGEGTLIWNSGSRTVKAGSVVVFTDIDNGSNTDFGSSIGSLIETGSFSLPSSSKDGIIIFTGSDENSPTTFISALQIGNDASVLGTYDMDGITLSNTGLQIGTSIVVFDESATPDGAVYNASRSSQSTYMDYVPEILDDTNNWINIVNGDGESLLPFSQEAFTIHTTNWTGTVNSDWNNSGNWDNGVPSSSSLAVIPDILTAPIIDTGATVELGNLVIDSGETLSVNNLNALSISGNLNINGDLILNSGSSLIVDGAVSDVLTYNRNIPTTNWHFISSPVAGQDIDAFASASGLASGTGNNLGLGDYNNATSSWEYYQSGASGTGNFMAGDGRAILLSSAQDIAFTGTMNTSKVQIEMTSNSNGFNLVGNPFPSYLAGNLNADSTHNILTLNSANLTENTLWFWNQATNSYDQVNQASSAFQISPAQGFFVSALGSANLEFTEAMQSHQGTDSFQRSSNPTPEINLVMTNGTEIRDTDIYYINGTTTGFDNGYDSSIFDGVPHEFVIYTHAVANGTGRRLGIQSLPKQDLENMVIPVGIKATSGSEITISATSSYLPASIKVYLEDRKNNSFTLLDDNSNFVMTTTRDLDGIGRFYLHTKTEVLSTDDISFNKISIYQSNVGQLRIVGVQSGTAQLQLYNVLGKRMMITSFNGSGVNDLTLPNLNTGMYIMQLTTETGILNRKIILE